MRRHKGGAEKREKSQRALLADGEKCCKLTDPFLKSSAASARTSANTASTNVSDKLSQHSMEKDRTVRNISKRRMKR